MKTTFRENVFCSRRFSANRKENELQKIHSFWAALLENATPSLIL